MGIDKRIPSKFDTSEHELIKALIADGLGPALWDSWDNEKLLPGYLRDYGFEPELQFMGRKCVSCDSLHFWYDYFIPMRGFDTSPEGMVSCVGGEVDAAGEWMCPACSRTSSYGVSNITVAKRDVWVR